MEGTKTGRPAQPDALRNRPASEKTQQADEFASEGPSFDNRPEALAQRKLADAIFKSSPMTAQRKQLAVFGKAATQPVVQLDRANQIMKEQMAARVTKDRAAKVTQAPAANVSQEPAAANVSQEPAAANVSQEPAAANVSQEPAAANVSQKPAAANVSQEPAAANVSQEPAAANVSQEPAAANVSQEPAAANVSQEPAAANVSQEPAAANVSQEPGAKATQDRVGKKIVNSREGFPVRKIEGINESAKLMNPAIKEGSSIDDVLAMVNTKGGPQEEYAAIMDKFRGMKGVEEVIVASPKDKEGTERKIGSDYSGEKDKEAGTAGIQRMVDLVRGSIVVAHIEDLPTVYEAIKAVFTTRTKDDVAEVIGLVRVKNNFAALEKVFNRDMNITVELPVSKMYCEIQVHVKAFEANKNRKKTPDKTPIKDDNDRKGWAFHGHIYYEASRVIKTEKGKSPEGVEKAKEILLKAEKSDEMANRDDAAFKKLTPAQTIFDEVDKKLKLMPELKPEEREHQWAETFKRLLMDYQAGQSQSLLLAEVMKSGLKENQS